MTTMIRESGWGYKTPQPLAPLLNSDNGADPELRQLWKEYQTAPAFLESWDGRKQVIDAAIRLFGNPIIWFGQQIHNPKLCLDRVEFLLDCLTVVGGGKRPLRIASRNALMDLQGNQKNSERIRSAFERLRVRVRPFGQESLEPPIPSDPSEFLVNWLRNSNTTDLLCSLVVLFGPADVLVG